MNPVILKFQLLHGLEWVEIEFETQSRQRNRLMEVIVMDKFHVDTSTLTQYNPEFYIEIKAAMKNNADSYWEDQDALALIPTLSYHLQKAKI